MERNGAFKLVNRSDIMHGARIAEIAAAVEALSLIEDGSEVYLYTDSRTLHDMLTLRDIRKMKLSRAERILNSKIRFFLKKHTITSYLIKRHALSEHKKCDYLARIARENPVHELTFYSLFSLE